MFKLKNKETGKYLESEQRPVLVSDVWECGTFRITDIDGLLYEVVEPEPVALPAKITVRAFRKRFTQVERVGLDMASIDNPSGLDDARATAASIRDFIKETDSAQYIDLNDDDTRVGVQYLESIGLIVEGRALEILDAPVPDAERP